MIGWEDVMVIFMWVIGAYMLIRLLGAAWSGKGATLGVKEIFFTMMASFWMILAFMEIVRYKQEPMMLVIAALVLFILYIYTYSGRVRGATLGAFGFGGKK